MPEDKSEGRLFLVMAINEHGQPCLYLDRPAYFYTRSDALKEAAQMASEHVGEEFAVFRFAGSYKEENDWSEDDD